MVYLPVCFLRWNNKTCGWGESNGCCLSLLKKAFDMVSYSILVVCRLAHCGRDRWSTRWMRNKLDGQSLRIMFSDSSSGSRPVTGGVSAGYALGLILFDRILLFFNFHLGWTSPCNSTGWSLNAWGTAVLKKTGDLGWQQAECDLAVGPGSKWWSTVFWAVWTGAQLVDQRKWFFFFTQHSSDHVLIIVSSSGIPSTRETLTN